MVASIVVGVTTGLIFFLGVNGQCSTLFGRVSASIFNIDFISSSHFQEKEWCERIFACFQNASEVKERLNAVQVVNVNKDLECWKKEKHEALSIHGHRDVLTLPFQNKVHSLRGRAIEREREKRKTRIFSGGDEGEGVSYQ